MNTQAMTKHFIINHQEHTAQAVNAAMIPPNAIACKTQPELQKLASAWSMADLTALYNNLQPAGTQRVNRFMNRTAGIQRVWKLLEALPVQEPTTAVASEKAVSKKHRVLELLREGVTIEAIMQATGWQHHSVRGFISIQNKRGINIVATGKGTERTYRATSSAKPDHT